jgi:hypothetical protein
MVEAGAVLLTYFGTIAVVACFIVAVAPPNGPEGNPKS